jgi:hypothetical protein
MKRYHFILSVVVSVFLCVFWMPTWAQLPQYQKTDLDALLGVESPQTKEGSAAVAVNDVGHVAGHYTLKVTGRATPQKSIGFIYRPETGIEELVAPSDRSVEVMDINDSDELVGTWETPQGVREPFLYHNGNFESLSVFKKVFRINNAGDILGVMEKPRGILPDTIAVMKKDRSVIDILDGVTDCDASVAGDCGLNRIDFDHWDHVKNPIDLNEKGEIAFTLSTPFEGCSTNGVYSYMPGVGVRPLYQQTFCMTPAGTGYFTRLSLNDNGMVLIGIRPGGWAPFGNGKLYSIDGVDRTPGTVLDSSVPPPAGLFMDNSVYSGYPTFHTINNSDVIAGKNRSIFSLTDYNQVYENSVLLGSIEPETIYYSNASVPQDINNSNVIVGTLKDKATIWTPNGQGTEGGIQIDGKFYDWAGYASYADATRDGTPQVDWDQAWFAQDSERLYISWSSRIGASQETFYLWNIYLDTDHDSTGYRFNLLGADYLIQGSSLYHYTGKGDDWSWQYIKEVEFAISGLRVEMGIDKASLNLSPNYQALFYAATEDGSQVDYLLTDITPSGGTVILEEVIAPGD